jgi:hypothetical protein
VRKTMIVGVLLAAVAGLLVNYGEVLGLELSRFALLGSAVGAALGLVPAGSPAGRAGAWSVGFLAAWVGYGLRAAVLPDTASGRAVAAVVVILAVSAVCALSVGFLPLWAGLLGVASLAGAYEVTFTAAPTTFAADSVTAVTTVALATALGFLSTSLLVQVVPAPAGDDEAHERELTAETLLPRPRTEQADAGLGIVDQSRSKA